MYKFTVFFKVVRSQRAAPMSLSHGYTMEDKFGVLVRQVKGRNLSNVASEITENVSVQFACELKALLHPVEIVSPYEVAGHKHRPLWQASNMTLGLEDVELQVMLLPNLHCYVYLWCYNYLACCAHLLHCTALHCVVGPLAEPLKL